MFNVVFTDRLLLLHIRDGILVCVSFVAVLFNRNFRLADFIFNSAHALLGFVIIIVESVVFRLLYGNCAVLFRKLRFEIVQAAHPKRNFKGFLFVGKLDELFRFFGLLQKRTDPDFKLAEDVP